MPLLNRPLLLPVIFFLIGTVFLAMAVGSEPTFGKESGRSTVLGAFVVEVELASVLERDEVSDYEAEGLMLHLPTSNDALLRGEGHAFFQGLNATVPGLRPQRWMGGQYGFVRNVARTPAGMTFTRIHQGVDIRPVYRDARGVPQDTVRAIDGGLVVYVNRIAGNSNYGRYIVMRHEWDGSPVYSLYAHMESVWVNAGTTLENGAPIGQMGYTGRGLDRARAHVHLEIALLLNEQYQHWHNAFYRGRNLHGLYFGRNLMGVDPAELYLALQENPHLTFSRYVRQQPVGYRLALPGNRPLNILERYPWLAADGVTPADREEPGAWLVSFTREGVPIEVARQAEPVTEPTVAYVAAEVHEQYLSTNGYLARTRDGYALTRNGRAFAALLATGRDGTPRWF